MKSVSVEEVIKVIDDFIVKFDNIFPVKKKDNTTGMSKDDILEYANAKSNIESVMLTLLSHYKLFVDRLNKSNDFDLFSEELFMRQLQEYKDKIANQIKERGNGDFNEQN